MSFCPTPANSHDDGCLRGARLWIQGIGGRLVQAKRWQKKTKRKQECNGKRVKPLSKHSSLDSSRTLARSQDLRCCQQLAMPNMSLNRSIKEWTLPRQKHWNKCRRSIQNPCLQPFKSSQQQWDLFSLRNNTVLPLKTVILEGVMKEDIILFEGLRRAKGWILNPFANCRNISVKLPQSSIGQKRWSGSDDPRSPSKPLSQGLVLEQHQLA